MANADQDEENALVPMDPLINIDDSNNNIYLELANQHYESYASNIKVDFNKGVPRNFV